MTLTDEQIMARWPEHEKLKAISDKSQAVGEFLEWLDTKGIRLCALKDGKFYPSQISNMQLLAAFFEIDQDKIEGEKRDMLNYFRNERIES